MLRWRWFERVFTSVGLVASGSALLCLFAFGVSWSPASDFLKLWLVVLACASPLGVVWLDRMLKPVFWP